MKYYGDDETNLVVLLDLGRLNRTNDQQSIHAAALSKGAA
jgi:hypothetical protein